MEQVIADKPNKYADTIKKLRSKYDFAELEDDKVASSWIDFLVTSWTKDGKEQLLKTNPESGRRPTSRGQDQGREGRRRRLEEPLRRRWSVRSRLAEVQTAPAEGAKAVALVDSTSTRSCRPPRCSGG